MNISLVAIGKRYRNKLWNIREVLSIRPSHDAHLITFRVVLPSHSGPPIGTEATILLTCFAKWAVAEVSWMPLPGEECWCRFERDRPLFALELSLK